MSLRRRTRETARHDRATVLQELGARADDPKAWQARRAIEESRMRDALLRANRGGGGHHDPEPRMGLVAVQGAGGTRSTPCGKCNDQAGGCWYCGRG